MSTFGLRSSRRSSRCRVPSPSAAAFNAQVGKGTIADLNTAAEKDLLTLPHMTPAIVKGLLEKRPFASIVELNTYLTGPVA